ncbi:MAG: exodeoxyribonuclease III [Chloroflexota bacterium]
MPDWRLLCWNVNGIRAVARKGLPEWLRGESPEVLCLQETKVQEDQLGQLGPEVLSPEGYNVNWSFAEKKGYSGVATFAREKPRRVRTDFGATGLDMEGRMLITEYPAFHLLNIYFPNGKKDESRLRYKMTFYDKFLDYVGKLKAAGEKLVVCGDFNTAHREIDLARPKENSSVSGFLPEERAWLDRFISHGFVDTFRHFHPEPHQYSFWDQKSGARARNVGWRIDYFFVSENLLPAVTDAFILPDVMGSDHCPVGIKLRVD